MDLVGTDGAARHRPSAGIRDHPPPFLGVLDRSAGRVAPLTGQGSHQVAALGKANALIVVPEGAVQMHQGETARVLVLP